MPKGISRLPRVRKIRVVVCFSPEEVAEMKEAVGRGEATCMSALVRGRAQSYPEIKAIMKKQEQFRVALNRSSEVVGLAMEIIKDYQVTAHKVHKQPAAEQEVVAH
ncbi:MAG: hypothetical protein RL292_246 [Candidatus Parcubacteria bacterium]|jgi:hypothetical protein